MTEDEIIAEAKHRAQVAFTPATAVRYEAYAEEVARQARNRTAPPVNERTKRAQDLAAIAHPFYSKEYLSGEYDDSALVIAMLRLVDAGCVIVTDEMWKAIVENWDYDCSEISHPKYHPALAPLFAKVKP